MQYIDGKWAQGYGDVLVSENPATGETIWEGHEASASQVSDAIAAAHAAFPAWAALSVDQRAEYLQKFRDYCEANKDSLIEILCKEAGKIGWDAAGEAGAVIGKLNAALAAYEERTPTRSKELNGVTGTVRHKPHGVMAVFGPYNFPMHIPGGHIVPALLAGNVIVFKPSELTPAGGQWLTKAIEHAGFPAGVVNLVQGGRAVGEALTAGDINGLLFTGSSEVGMIFHKQFAGRPEVILALELGGNNPLIVSKHGEKAEDIQGVAYEIVQSAFMSAGQRCTCARRLILVENAHTDTLIDTLANMAKALKIGVYDDADEPFMGPLIHNREVNKALAMQASLQEAGAEIVLEGARLDEVRPFLSPAILDVTSVYLAGKLEDKEIFAPQLKIIRVKSLEEAVKVANDTKFGLSSAIFSEDRAEYDYCVANLRAGLLNWNKMTTGASGMAPFGGCGLSGNHRPAGFYAADYCAYPVASMEQPSLSLPEKLAPGVSVS